MRWVALGDPQARAETFLAVLHHRGLLTPTDALADGTVLLSIGDHFDFKGADPATDWSAGLSVLTWLTDQDPARTILLLGNHDTARVQELAGLTDASFAAARALAAAAHGPDAPAAAVEEYHRRYPELPAAGLV